MIAIKIAIQLTNLLRNTNRSSLDSEFACFGFDYDADQARGQARESQWLGHFSIRGCCHRRCYLLGFSF